MPRPSSGPAIYSERYGDESFVVRIHSGNGPHEETNRRAIRCFDAALQDVGLDADTRLRQVLHAYWAWATTTSMDRYHESAATSPTGCAFRAGLGRARHRRTAELAGICLRVDQERWGDRVGSVGL